MRVHGTKLGAISTGRGLGDQLYDLAGQVSPLDLNFAGTKTLDPRVTHTRASGGTFVDGSGVLRSAVTNLLLRSEEFNDAYWIKSGATISSNVTAAPNGFTTADKLVETATSGQHIVYAGSLGLASNIYTASVYAKAAERTELSIFIDTSVTRRTQYFNLSTGALGASSGGITSAIQAVGNGWYRCSVTLNAAESLLNVAYTVSFSGSNSYLGDGTSGIYLWGAQLEQASTVGEYIPTTSVINSAPRFDHNPTTGESLGLLVEEARTNLLLQSENFGTTWAANGLLAFGSGSTLNALTAPDGQTTADLITENTSNSQHNVNQTSTTTGAKRFSVFAKQGPGARLLRLIDFNATDGAQGETYFNLSTGAVVSGPGTIQALPNGWYRCSIQSTTTVTSTYFISIATSALAFAYTGDGASGVYLWGAQLEVGAFPTSYIPTTSATATRAADVASITGANFGVTRTNLIVRSEEFDNASWVKTDLTVTANTNETVAPNGINTAELYDDGTNSGTHYLAQTAGITASTTYTASIYAKKDSLNYINVGVTDIAVGDRFAVASFNVNNGTVSASSASGTGYSVLSTSVSSAGNGWYRCIIAFITGSTAVAPRFIIASSTDGTVPAGSGGIQAYAGANNQTYIWGAQLETGSAATPYIQSPSVFTSRASSATYVGSDGLIKTATTNEARYDHDPVSLISKGLLLEGASANLFLNSEDFSNPTWTAGAITVTANAATAPTGATTADSLLETSANTEHLIYNATPITFTTATQSVYVKPNGRTNVALRFYYDSNDWVARVFSLTGNGSVTQSSAGSSSGFSSVSSSIVNAGNGWYRISMTATQTGRFVYVASPDLCTSSTPTLASINGSEVYAGDVTKGVYVWGAQLETASTVSSYIPTAASTVTRAADVSTSTATSVFESSFYNQTEGTVFLEFGPYGNGGASKNPGIVQIDSGTAANTIRMFSGASISPVLDVTTSSVNQAYISSGALTPSLTSKITGAYKVNDFARAVNGSNLGTDSSGTVPTLSQMLIGTGNAGVSELCGTIKRLTYWPTRLGNEVLQRITQP